MRRFLTLVCLLGLAIPAGITLEGCTRNPGANYCNGLGYGLKDTDVAAMVLQPETAGLSLSFGQTGQAQTPSATTCKGTSASVNSKDISYGTSNNQIVDISSSGAICAGTWNRNTGGGIADYTYCNPPSTLPSTNGLPYAVAYITASAYSVTSNPVAVYVHVPVTSVTLVGPQQCLSQTKTAQLDSEGCYAVNGVQYELCAPASVVTSGKYSCPGGLAPGVTKVSACNSSIGTMNFSVANSAVASIDYTTNIITALQPGTTAITASIAQSGSSAGYFSTCPPVSISLALPNGATSGQIAQGTPENLTTTAIDANGNTITGMSLTYESTNQMDITASAAGTVNTSYPGFASLTVLCAPSSCNPAPTNLLGSNGTGLAISSNSVNITVPGTASDYLWFAAPGVSQYFVPIELITGTIGSTVKMPFVPNSAVMDKGGNNIYFGSARELFSFNTVSNGLGTETTNAPGVVLAVSPDNSTVLVNDQARHLFYLYTVNGGSILSFSGMGNAAAFTPDSQTLYITDNAQLNTPAACGTANITGHTDALYVYNRNSGWSTYPLPASPLPPSQIPPCSALPNYWAPVQSQTPAVTIPSVGAYLRGALTQAHTWCPSGTVGSQATIQYYPLGDSQPVQSDALAATVEGQHILGAQWNAGGSLTLNDIAVTVPTGLKTNGILTPAACTVTTNPVTQVQTMLPLTISSSVTSQTVAASGALAANAVITGATPVPPSGGAGASLAFVTYSGSTTGAALPYYLPATGGAAGTLGYVPLTGSSSITAPIAGAFSPDNTYFFVSTAGDNKVHYIKIPNMIGPSSLPTDSQQISPNLPACNPATDTGCQFNGPGTVVPATVIFVKPRATT
jgi:hypothetical protein